MAVTVNSKSGNTAVATNTVTVTAPAGITDNDLLLAACACFGTTWNTPSGWTLYETLNSGAYRIFYKVASGESGNYTFTTAGSGPLAVAMLDITGNGGQTPEANSGSNNGTGTTGTALAVTTLGANRLDIACFFWNSGATSTVQGSLVEQQTEINSTFVGVDVASLAQATQGSSGNQTTTFGSSTTWYATLLAVPPAAADTFPAYLPARQVFEEEYEEVLVSY